jgi:hypothetical protein
MKVVLPVVALFNAFKKVEGSECLVQAKVVTAGKKSIKLEGIGNSQIELAYEGDAALKAGQTIQFNIEGLIAGTPELAKVAAKPQKTGSSSPAYTAPAAGRDGFSRRLD